MSMIGFHEAVHTAQMQSGVSQTTEGLTALFYSRPMKNEAESEAQGRPIFEPHDYVLIRIPSDAKSVIDREVKEEDKQRWPEAWRAYDGGEQGKVIGMPLREWNFLTTTRRMELEAMGLRTVEELAHMADGQKGRLGPDGRKLCDRARQFLEAGDDIEVELRKDIQARDDEIKNMMAEMAILRRQVDEMREGAVPKVDKRTKAYRDRQKAGE